VPEHVSATDPVLSVENLAVTYLTRDGAVPAVRDVSFDIAKGETFGLVGESGSGKSTVALAIMNYLGASGRATGSIRYAGKDMLTLGPRALRTLRGSRIAMVYQDPMSALNPAIPVGDQIAEGLRIHQGLGKQKAAQRAIEMMRKTHIPDPEVNARRYPHQLSGGMQQRVVISMALINNPDVLILDEPTTGLDVTTEATILDLIAELRHEYNSAVLFITHDLGVIAQVSDRIGVMYAGEMVEVGDTRSIFRQPQHPYTLALLSTAPSVLSGNDDRLVPIPGRLPDLRHLPPGCVFEPRCRFAEDVCRESSPPLAPKTEPTHRAACFFSDKLPPPGADATAGGDRVSPQLGEPMLVADDVRVFFEERSLLDTVLRRPESPVQAVDGVTLTLRRGETVGLVGESGSGKTTFGKTLVRLYDPTSGTLTIGGTNVRDLTAAQDRDVRKRVQFIFQNPESALNPRKTVGDIISRPLRLYKLVEEEAIPDRVAELLSLVNLRPEFANRLPHELSGGEKQRIGIARAFAAEPDVIVADEPLSALDVSVQASILNLLNDLQVRYGTSYLFISHDLGTVRHLCDRVYVMYLGNVYESGTVEQVYSPPYHPYTEALLSAIPVPDPTVSRDRIRLEGPVPSPRRPPSGCKFHTRCPRKWGPICEQEPPPGQEVVPGHMIFCHRPLETLNRELFADTDSEGASSAASPAEALATNGAGPVGTLATDGPTTDSE
jgi:peptide/nickel transport system ATP-binding protein